MKEYELLIRELVKYPKETEWIEFKRNNGAPEEMGVLQTKVKAFMK